MEALQMPFSNLQLELLKIFVREVSDEDLLEIKRLITQFFAQKAIAEANKVWDEKGWTEAEAQRMLQTHMRTPYRTPKSKTPQ